MPLMVEQLLKTEEVDAIVTLGAVIKGETGHDVVIANNTARLLADLSKISKTYHTWNYGTGYDCKAGKE